MVIFPSGPASLKNNHAFIFYRTNRLIPRFEKADQTYDQQTLTLEQARILVAAMLVAPPPGLYNSERAIWLVPGVSCTSRLKRKVTDDVPCGINLATLLR